MVYVFPLLLTPYAKSRPFSPCKSFSTNGKVVVVKKLDCGVDGGKIWSKEKMRDGLGIVGLYDSWSDQLAALHHLQARLATGARMRTSRSF